LIVGRWWRLFSEPKTPERASPPRAVTQTPATPAASSAPLAVAIQPANRADDDARCIVKASPAPAEIDAGAGDEPFQAPPRGVVRQDTARERILARLRSSPDPYANAVAVWLDVHDNAMRIADRARKLAAMAASTHEPRRYSLALRTCWWPTDGQCGSLLDMASSSGCDGLRAKLAFLRRMAVEGEVSASRGLMP
jgi:hypothetical protein